MEHKTIPFYSIKVDETQGVVEAVFSVAGVVDEGLDIVHPGAFSKTFIERGQKIQIIDQHRTDSVSRILGKLLTAREITKEQLPPTLAAQYPDATGAATAEIKFFMDTDEGKGAFIRAKENALQWSFGYDALDFDYTKATKNGKEIQVRNLRTIRLWEISPVIFPMNMATMTASAKDAGPSEGKPYGVVHEDNGKWCVYKLGEDGKPTGKPMGTHDTEEEARAQMRALYANMHDEGKAFKESWSATMMNDLPDSCFLYVEEGEKDGDGKTTPRSKRHLPYKDSSGKVDLPHLRNAISRLSQSGTGEGWLSEELRARLLARARRMLANAGGKELGLDDLKEIVALIAGLLPNDDAPSDTNTSGAGPVSPPTKEIDAEGLLKQIELAEAEINLMEV